MMTSPRASGERSERASDPGEGSSARTRSRIKLSCVRREPLTLPLPARAGRGASTAAGVRDLAQTIVDGGLDLHLGRPRHPLPSLLLSRSAPSGLGDLASALVFWLWLAGRGMAELPLLILVAPSSSGAASDATPPVTACSSCAEAASLLQPLTDLLDPRLDARVAASGPAPLPSSPVPTRYEDEA